MMSPGLKPCGTAKRATVGPQASNHVLVGWSGAAQVRAMWKKIIGLIAAVIWVAFLYLAVQKGQQAQERSFHTMTIPNPMH